MNKVKVVIYQSYQHVTSQIFSNVLHINPLLISSDCQLAVHKRTARLLYSCRVFKNNKPYSGYKRRYRRRRNWSTWGHRSAVSKMTCAHEVGDVPMTVQSVDPSFTQYSYDVSTKHRVRKNSPVRHPQYLNQWGTKRRLHT